MSGFRYLAFGLVLLTLVRMAFAAMIDLMPEEALIVLCSQKLEWSFVEMGPGAPALAKLSSWVFGPGYLLGVRVFAPFIVLGISVFLYRLIASIYDLSTAAWVVLILNLLPWANYCGVFATTEAPMTFFAVLATLGVWRGLHRAHPWNLAWPIAGLAAGLGIMFHPAGIAVPVGVWFVMTIVRRWRGRLRSPGLYLFTVVCLAVCLPWIEWHSAHDWRVVKGLFQGSLLSHENAWPSLIHHAWMISLPLGAALAAIAFFRLWRFGSRPDGEQFLLALGIAGLLTWGVTSVFGQGCEGSFSLVIVFFLPLIADTWRNARHPPMVFRLAWYAALMAAAVGSMMTLAPEAGHAGRFRIPVPAAISERQGAASELARFCEAILQNLPAGGEHPQAFIIVDDPATAAALRLRLNQDTGAVFGEEVQLVAGLGLRSSFDLWPRYDGNSANYLTRNALVLSPGDGEKSSLIDSLRNSFRAVSVLGDIAIRRGDDEGPGRVSLIWCVDYRGLPH